MARPDLSRVPEYYHGYIGMVTENEVLSALEKGRKRFNRLLEGIPRKKRSYRYAKGKWSVRELVQHVIDAERVFAYRALCFARRDPTPLPPFDENEYAINSKAEGRKWKDLVREFNLVRDSSIVLFRSFDEEQLESAGTANNKSIYVLAIGFIIAGHAAHHAGVLRERYL